MFFFKLLSTILFFFCLYLYFEIKKIKENITSLEMETKTILERKLYNHKEDTISIDNISIDISDDKLEEKNTSIDQTKIKESSKEEDNILARPEPYVARTNQSDNAVPKFKEPTATSIKKELSAKSIKEKAIVMSNLTLADNFNPIDFINTSKNTVNNDVLTTFPSTTDYLQEISNNLQEELTPQTIELTGYEKIQEEQAIISYKELLSLKEKIKNQDKGNAFPTIVYFQN